MNIFCIDRLFFIIDSAKEGKRDIYIYPIYIEIHLYIDRVYLQICINTFTYTAVTVDGVYIYLSSPLHLRLTDRNSETYNHDKGDLCQLWRVLPTPISQIQCHRSLKQEEITKELLEFVPSFSSRSQEKLNLNSISVLRRHVLK